MDIISQINKWIESLSVNPYITVTGFIVGIIGFFYALYVSRRDHKFKILRYRLQTSNLIENGETIYPKLEVTYEGRKLNNFTVTKVFIFNDGTEVILPTDVAPNDPLQISIPDEDIELLEVAIVHSNNPLNNFQIEVSNKTIQVQFDYCEPRNSVTIELLHTGIDSDCVNISGTIIGARARFFSNRTKDMKDVSKIYRPGEKVFQKFMDVSPRLLAMMSSLGFLIVCSFPIYYFFTSSNYLFGFLCAIPAGFFLLVMFVTIFSRKKPDEDKMLADSFRTMIFRSLSNNKNQEK